MCLPRFLYDEIPPNSSNLWRENRAAVTIQRSYRDHRHRKRQAAARKIQNFMRQSRIKLRKMHEQSAAGCTMEQGVETEVGVLCLPVSQATTTAHNPVVPHVPPFDHRFSELLQYDECLSSTGGIPPSAPLSSVHYGNCQSDGYGQQAPTITADGSATARSQCHLAPGGSSAYIQQHKPSVYPPPTNGSLATDPHYPTEQQQHAQW
ncbi:unnamed protein product, partial [Mesorhabditis belari]|uniref:Uncharacterized protein n=1 Tax=Mesorhabditis belari TaxID=2138241 RepID=A0AAF3EP56_9BILA